MNCDCQHTTSPETGLIVREKICERHRPFRTLPEEIDSSYYRRLGTLSDANEINQTNHVQELLSQIVDFDLPNGKRLLEIGCGVSPYVSHLIQLGFEYTGLDASKWVCNYLNKKFNVEAIAGRFEDVEFESRQFDLILAAHVLEHIVDPISALEKMKRHLSPTGRIILLVPEGTDLINPDHDCFFTVETLSNCIHQVGLCIQLITTVQIVEHERFIYAVVSPIEFPRFAPGVSGAIYTTLSEEGMLTYLLPKNGTMLEIGSANGGTAHQVAIARPEASIVCIDAFCDPIATYEYWQRNQRENMVLFKGYFTDYLKHDSSASFDVVFIDGDHHYESCLMDIYASVELLKEGGFIAVHDYGDPNHRDVTNAVHAFCIKTRWQFYTVTGSLAVLRNRDHATPNS
jgi:SAM-dependent methyltransferase